MVQNGQCLCGDVKVTVKEGSLPLQSVACHCLNCRTTAGSAFSLVSMIDLNDLEIEGTPKKYEDTNSMSGATVTRNFCGSCGTPIHSQTPNVAGKTFLKLGLFAGTSEIASPSMEVFWKNHEKWEKVRR